jgi:hypothetical protein
MYAPVLSPSPSWIRLPSALRSNRCYDRSTFYGYNARLSVMSMYYVAKRTRVPSRLISSAVGLVQTSETRCAMF